MIPSSPFVMTRGRELKHCIIQPAYDSEKQLVWFKRTGCLMRCYSENFPARTYLHRFCTCVISIHLDTSLHKVEEPEIKI